MDQDSCGMNSRIMYVSARWRVKNRGGERRATTEQHSEISSFLHLLCPGCTLPDVSSYSSDTKHNFPTKPLIAIISPSNNSTTPLPSSHHHPPDHSSQWPSALSCLICNPTATIPPPMRLPLATSIHPYFNLSPSYKLDSSWPLRDTHTFTWVQSGR